MSKLIIFIEEGKTKTIGVNPKCTDEEINDIAKKLVPEGITYEIITEEEYKELPEVKEDKRVNELKRKKEEKKKELRQAYIDSQIQTQLNAVDNVITEEELNNIGV